MTFLYKSVEVHTSASAHLIPVDFFLKKCIHETMEYYCKMKCVMSPLWNWVKLKVANNVFLTEIFNIQDKWKCISSAFISLFVVCIHFQFSLMWWGIKFKKHVLELFKRKPKVHVKNIPFERTLNLSPTINIFLKP